MAAPFPEAEFEALVYILLGVFMTSTAAAVLYIRKLHRKLDQKDEMDGGKDLRTDNIGLSRRAEDVMNAVMDQPMLQSELPDELEVSKATVSNAVSELFDRNLIKKRKKANTYLIEPRLEELEEQQRKKIDE